MPPQCVSLNEPRALTVKPHRTSLMRKPDMAGSAGSKGPGTARSPIGVVVVLQSLVRSYW